MKANKNASYVIAGIAAAAAGLLILYFAVFSPRPESEIITDPRITQEEAIDIVSNDLRNRYPGFEDSDLILFASGKPQSVKEFLQSGSQLPLIYYHPNGTQFRIDSDTHTIKSSCPPDICSFDFEGRPKNKLVYVLEIDCQECGFQHYVVDAIDESVVYKSPNLSPPQRNQTNQNQTPPSYA